MPPKDDEKESRILEAVATYQHGENTNITSLHNEYHVPYHALQSRIKGNPSRKAPLPANQTLDKAQEDAVKLWIKQLDEAGRPPTAEMVTNCTNTILCQSHENPETTPPTISKMWTYHFLQHLPPEYKCVKQHPMDPKHIWAEDIGIVQTFYDHWEIAIKTHGIWPCNIYNMDETGFQIGQGKVEKVITAFPEASANIGSAMTCKLVTVVECISAEGKAINPFLVLAGSYHLEDWYKDCGLPDNWMITLTPNGYITDEGGYDWIHHFEIETHPSTSWEYWLLLLDNHGSHLTYDFLHFCEECWIML